MPQVVETLVYSFDELNDAAKENARDWYRGCIESDEIGDLGDDVDIIAAILGVQFDTKSVRLMGGGTRQENAIYWGLYPTWCAFDGSYSYAKGAPKAIRAHAPQDTELHRIADELQATQRSSFYGLTATCKERREYMSVDVFDRHDDFANADTAHRLADLLRDFASWIARQIETNGEWLMSEENVDDVIRANGYTFDENGRIN